MKTKENAPAEKSVLNTLLVEKIQDWIANTALVDGGKLFWTQTEDSERSQITYGDLRKLIKLLDG